MKRKRKQFTTEKIAAAPVNWHDAEFVDLKGLNSRFAIKRSLAYKLMKEGAIKGMSLRVGGATRGRGFS
jgi:hypothetical protein